ncbi:MAG TPA: orotate phosphoribosyltransferase [Planctomycetes bacterium]|nr:orotate phosphoribosyltransferase [Planctomycetota bacterium]
MDERAELYGMVAGCVIRHRTPDIKLSSGKMSDFYFDGRRITLDARGLELISTLFWRQMSGTADAVGGLTMGADPITGGVLTMAAREGRPLKGFICRKAAKEHGMGKVVEGPELPRGARVALVDDVATTGSSFIKAFEALEAQYGAGYLAQAGCYAVVDREEGAVEALAERGLVLCSLFLKSDFPAA